MASVKHLQHWFLPQCTRHFFFSSNDKNSVRKSKLASTLFTTCVTILPNYLGVGYRLSRIVAGMISFKEHPIYASQPAHFELHEAPF